MYDLDFPALEARIATAASKLRGLGIDWFGPDELGDMPRNKPSRYGVAKVRRLQKERRPAAFISRDWFRFASTTR